MTRGNPVAERGRGPARRRPGSRPAARAVARVGARKNWEEAVPSPLPGGHPVEGTTGPRTPPVPLGGHCSDYPPMLAGAPSAVPPAVANRTPSSRRIAGRDVPGAVKG
ncbi:hypothetical protein [Umezawaea tangerina]|uniref:Uncharacterized protein n=1 Tax=Umezawaea tangerina TaxID=84725 RepID=A0A2T0T9P1_9PSEU|nr:hypothetical protein [Umezawaea tangerina]PRY42381.1 hypothetical protein CLV43_104214 [Umezawaea tangerina]